MENKVFYVTKGNYNVSTDLYTVIMDDVRGILLWITTSNLTKIDPIG